MPATDSLTIRTTCTNRDLPARLPFGNDSGDFDLETSFGNQTNRGLEKADEHSPASHRTKCFVAAAFRIYP